MTSEVDIQTKIINEVKSQGGYGRKMSNRFAVGVLDLYLSLDFPRLSPMPFLRGHLEVKLIVGQPELWKGRPISLKHDITGPQKLEMAALHKSGAPCGWVGVRIMTGGANEFWASKEPDLPSCEVYNYNKFVRSRGESWAGAIGYIADRIMP